MAATQNSGRVVIDAWCTGRAVVQLTMSPEGLLRIKDAVGTLEQTGKASVQDDHGAFIDFVVDVELAEKRKKEHSGRFWFGAQYVLIYAVLFALIVLGILNLHRMISN